MAIINPNSETQFSEIDNVLLCMMVKQWWYHSSLVKDDPCHHGGSVDSRPLLLTPDIDPNHCTLHFLNLILVSSHPDDTVGLHLHNAHVIIMLMARILPRLPTHTSWTWPLFIYNTTMNIDIRKKPIFQPYNHPSPTISSHYPKGNCTGFWNVL